MYMGPIIADETRAELAPRPATSPMPSPLPAHPALRMTAGVPVLLLAALVMLPWAAVIALSAGVVLGARALLCAPQAMIQAADYAGRVALGR